MQIASEGRSSWQRKLPFAVAIFTSAFLVFQVQPVIARFILPWYGGSAGVWTVCMLFFQLGLLAGYAYAHGLALHLNRKQQVVVHCILLALSLLALPITPSLPELSQNTPVTLQILAVLALSVGIPFVLLSASAPLLQHWFAQVNPGTSPFRLYALSNVGSLLALLSYPFWVERTLGLLSQTLIWSFAYFGYMGMVVWCAWFVFRLNREETTGSVIVESSPEMTIEPVRKSDIGDKLMWILLAACGSIALIAITNQMSLDVSVVPFLWVIPLSLYLITFIISFERDAWYQRTIWVPFFILSVGLLVYLLSEDYGSGEMSLAYQIMIYCGALFGCCMICHGELVRRRSDAKDLTMFYVYVALGGAVGGVFVNLVAPLIFNGYWELHGLLVVISLIILWSIGREETTGNVLFKKMGLTAGYGGVAVLILFLGLHIADRLEETILNTRSFYGMLHVYEEDAGTRDHIRKLRHGRIGHGKQLVHNTLERIPTSYYGPETGAGLALDHHPVRRDHNHPTGSIKVGAIGLGVGTIAAYGRPLDTFRFYEISADVEVIANEYFTYLSKSKAAVDVAIGDGRRVMQSEYDEGGSQNYDVIIVDAFSGDAIPVHLLTQEASDLYWKHLNEDGILVIHISNLHIDLSDVVRQMASHAGKEIFNIDDDGDSHFYMSGSSWVVITDNEAFLNDELIQDQMDEWDHELNPIVWTDDFSNLFDVVEW